MTWGTFLKYFLIFGIYIVNMYFHENATCTSNSSSSKSFLVVGGNFIVVSVILFILGVYILIGLGAKQQYWSLVSALHLFILTF